jgi:SAM-dependent methyltransferase
MWSVGLAADASERATSPNERLQRELDHHRELAGRRTEEIWGWDSPAGRRRADRRARIFISRAALGPGRRVLELGCGTGEFTRRVASSGASIVALDLSPELLAKARARVGARESVWFIRGNAEILPFPCAHFDAVFGCSVLHHLNLETTLAEVQRVLRPGGRLTFSEPNLFNPQVFLMFKVRGLRARFGVSPDEMAFSRATITRALQRLGFGQISVRHFDFLHPSIPGVFLPVVEAALEGLERVPFVRSVSGSLLIDAVR